MQISYRNEDHDVAPRRRPRRCARTALAQNVIEWSAARRLTKDDFKGRVPASAENSSLSWLNIDASWECEEGRLRRPRARNI